MKIQKHLKTIYFNLRPNPHLLLNIQYFTNTLPFNKTFVHGEHLRKLSFNFLEWAKKYVSIPSKEEARKIIRQHDKKEIFEAYKKVFDLFRNKKSFNLQGLKNSILLVAALFVLLGNIAQAGLPTLDNLEQENQSFFNSLDKPEKVKDLNNRDYYKNSFLNAMSEFEEVYKKIKTNSDFKEDAQNLKKVLDTYTKVKKNIDSIELKELIKARTIAMYLQSNAYFGYLAEINEK